MLEKSPLYSMITCPCTVDRLTPHFYIVKLGFGSNFIFIVTNTSI